jgi:guanyl-specific ribonuclease Sa
MKMEKDKAAKIARLRKQAEDKSLPADVRNQLLDNANMLEEEMAKEAGVRLAKGGAVKRDMPKRGARSAKAMAMGGMANYAKGGMVKANCGASVPASGGKGKK